MDLVQTISDHAMRGILFNLLTHPDEAVRAHAANEVRMGLCAEQEWQQRQQQQPKQEVQEKEQEEAKEEDVLSEKASTDASWDLAEAQPVIETEAPSAVPVMPSAKVLGCTDLALGVEAQDAVVGGDVTAEFAPVVAEAGAKQAYLAGRVTLPVGLTAPVPACAKVVIVNDGEVPWPETAALVVVAGDAMGFPHMALGALQPGEAAEVAMDLLLPTKAARDTSRSAWALVNASTGQPLGPLIFFEGLWL